MSANITHPKALVGQIPYCPILYNQSTSKWEPAQIQNTQRHCSRTDTNPSATIGLIRFYTPFSDEGSNGGDDRGDRQQNRRYEPCPFGDTALGTVCGFVNIKVSYGSPHVVIAHESGVVLREQDAEKRQDLLVFLLKHLVPLIVCYITHHVGIWVCRLGTFPIICVQGPPDPNACTLIRVSQNVIEFARHLPHVIGSQNCFTLLSSLRRLLRTGSRRVS